MSNNVLPAGSPWSAFSGPNLGYVLEQYDLFLQSPEEVEPELVELFKAYGGPVFADGQQLVATAAVTGTGDYKKVLAAVKLAESIREYGHLAADLYPLKNRQLDTSRIEESVFNLTAADLQAIPASVFFANVPAGVTNGKEAIDYLKSVYTDKIGVEVAHLQNAEERAWIEAQVEGGTFKTMLSAEEKKAVLERLTRIENFEKFIHKTFVGQKRFSGEGLDTQIILLDEIIKSSEAKGVKNVR